MKYEQRVIAKLLFNDGLDACQIPEKLRAQFHEGSSSFRTVQFSSV
jgi:hypothetical protein